MAERTDEQLIEGIRAGDREAERILYERYKQFVRSRAHSYFLIGADHEDLVQEGMLGLYKAVCEYDAGKAASFKSFAEVCVTRQILSAIKNATRKKHTPLNNYISLNRSPVEANGEFTLLDTVRSLRVADPEEVIIGRENFDRLVVYLEQVLSPMERRVLGLYLDGYSYPQIAAAIEKPLKSVDNAMQRVKHKLEAFRN
ncbi:MAG: RNA polymerase sporulation sigma factor SigH [Clostridia bacterium]|jgi:RNA polymerase sporulation-specific sigma factor|nr:RNA polymerase sporulation sigma factor SigH [Clostridia bacterium]